MRNWVDLTGESVLRTLDEHSGMSWQCLIKLFDLERVPPGEMQLWNCLWTLNRAGLLAIDGVPSSLVAAEIEQFFSQGSQAQRRKIRSSPMWMETQQALNEVFLGSKGRGDPLLVNPLFGRPTKIADQMDLFVLMPFDAELKPVYSDHITTVAKKLNLTVYRADDFFTADMIMKDVWNAICGAGAIIADCTNRVPNVFYELGVAHTVGKPVILITQNAEDVPFDLRHLRYIKYDYTPRGMKEFEATLEKTVIEAMHIYR